MNKLLKNEAGVAHLLLIVVFVVALLGLVGFAYTRISDTGSTSEDTALEEEQAGESETDDSDDDASTDPVAQTEDTEATSEAQ